MELALAASKDQRNAPSRKPWERQQLGGDSSVGRYSGGRDGSWNAVANVGCGQLLPNGLRSFCPSASRSVRLKRSRSCRSMSELSGSSDQPRPPHLISFERVKTANGADVLDTRLNGMISGRVLRRPHPDHRAANNGQCSTTLLSGAHETTAGDVPAELVSHESSDDHNTLEKLVHGSNHECDGSLSHVTGYADDRSATAPARRVTFNENITNIEALLRCSRRAQAKQRRLQQKLATRASASGGGLRSVDGEFEASGRADKVMRSSSSCSSILKTMSSQEESSQQDRVRSRCDERGLVITTMDPGTAPEGLTCDTNGSMRDASVPVRYHITRSVQTSRFTTNDSCDAEQLIGSNGSCTGSSIGWGSDLGRDSLRSTVMGGSSMSQSGVGSSVLDIVELCESPSARRRFRSAVDGNQPAIRDSGNDEERTSQVTGSSGHRVGKGEHRQDRASRTDRAKPSLTDRMNTGGGINTRRGINMRDGINARDGINTRDGVNRREGKTVDARDQINVSHFHQPALPNGMKHEVGPQDRTNPGNLSESAPQESSCILDTGSCGRGTDRCITARNSCMTGGNEKAILDDSHSQEQDSQICRDVVNTNHELRGCQTLIKRHVPNDDSKTADISKIRALYTRFSGRTTQNELTSSPDVSSECSDRDQSGSQDPGDSTVRYQLSRAVHHPGDHCNGADLSLIRSESGSAGDGADAEIQNIDPECCNVFDRCEGGQDHEGWRSSEERISHSSSLSLISHHCPVQCGSSDSIIRSQDLCNSGSVHHNDLFTSSEYEYPFACDFIRTVSHIPGKTVSHDCATSDSFKKVDKDDLDTLSCIKLNNSHNFAKSLKNKAGKSLLPDCGVSPHSETGQRLIEKTGTGVVNPDDLPVTSHSLNDSLLTPAPKPLDPSQSEETLLGIMNRPREHEDRIHKAHVRLRDVLLENSQPVTGCDKGVSSMSGSLVSSMSGSLMSSRNASGCLDEVTSSGSNQKVISSSSVSSGSGAGFPDDSSASTSEKSQFADHDTAQTSPDSYVSNQNSTCRGQESKGSIAAEHRTKSVHLALIRSSSVTGQRSSDDCVADLSGDSTDKQASSPLLLDQTGQDLGGRKHVPRCRQKIQRRNAFRRSKSTSDASNPEGSNSIKRRLTTSQSVGDMMTLVGEASLGMSASRSTEALQRVAEHFQHACVSRPAAYKQLGVDTSPGTLPASKKMFYASCPDVKRLTGWIAHLFKSRSRDTSLKLLVVPKDEDILQMAYQSSAYRQGKEPYKGSATEIPQPPQLNPSSSQDVNMPPAPSSVYHPTRYKSEIRFIPADGSHASPNKLAGFDPHQPQQRLSVSSVGSVSSSSSYSTSKDVGMVPGQQADVTFDADASEDASAMTASTKASSEGRQDGGRVVTLGSHVSHPSATMQRGGSSVGGFTTSCAVSSQSDAACSSQAPPAAPTRSSSKNITFINFQPSASTSSSQCQGHSDFVQPVCYNPQMAAPCHDRRQCPKAGSLENLERMGDGSTTKNSDMRASHKVEPPASVEKLLRTGYETKFRKSARDGLRHSSDNLLSNVNTSHDWQKSGSHVSSTRLPPGSSTTITLTQQPYSKTTSSSLLPPSGRQPSSQWTSDTQVYKMSVNSPASSRHLPTSSTSCSAKDVVSSAGQHHNGRVPGGRPDSYGLTVSLHIDSRNSNYADGERNVPNVSRRGERNSVPEHHMINMVSERLKKFESAESVDSGVPSWCQRKQKDCHGYDSVRSRAAEFESRRGDDDDRSRRKRSSRNSPISTPAGSTTSLPQALPPPEINKVPPTPPATINFYFREGMSQSQASSINLEPSPERLLNQSADGFRMRVSSEPPGGSVREPQNQDGAYVGGMSVSYAEKTSSPVGRRRPAARQPSYLAAVSPAREGESTSTDTLTVTTSTSTSTTPVTFRERSRSEDREARLVRRTSYLLATGRQRSGGYQDPNRVDVTQLVLPSPPSAPTTQGNDYTVSRPRLDLPPSSGAGSLPSSGSSLAQCKEVAEPGDSPDNKSPMTPTAPQSPPMDTVTTPTKTSNIKKLKNLFGEKTPRILEAISDKRSLFDMPSPAGDVRLEGPLLCKIAVTDGKRASDRSWKPCYAQLRGGALFLFKDKNNSSPTPFEDQPISIKSSIVDIAYDYTKKKNVFRLTTYNGSEYLFQADDHDTMLQWIRMIQDNNNPEEDKQGSATSDLIIRKAVQQQESATVNKSSPQVAQKGKEKKTSTRSLRSKSPSSHSPASKPKKQLSEKDLMDPSGQKPKDTKTWKDRMAKKFKRYGSSSSASADMPETSESSEITGTFGVPLEACPCSSFSEYVPLVVEVCTKIVEERGLEYQGIYRVPGNTGAVNILQEELNRAVDYESLELESEKWMDVNVVGSLLKSFFRKLPEPLITEDLYQAMIAANRIPNQEKRMLKIKKLIHDLPEHNFETFRYIAEHLNKVSEKGDLNKMDGRNLAIVFGPTLIRTSDENMVTMVTDMSDQCRIVESIIANYKWFFSSWFEDVNVPVEEQTDTVPVSGMNQELIVKAENLGDRGRDVSVKDLMSSVIQAANRKIRKKDKPKTSDSVDIDMESEPNSYNERNIDKEIELRKGKDTLQNCLTKEGSVTLEQTTTSTTTASSSVSVHESKSSLSLDYGNTREAAQTSSELKTSASSLAGMSAARSGTSLNQLHEGERWSPPDGGTKNGNKQQGGLPIKHYPAYPKVDISSPQTENSKPSLLKKYSCDELPRNNWGRDDDEASAHGDGRREQNDEVKKTYGLTQQTRQHLRRIEKETEALRQHEMERQKNQERATIARQRIERELQKTRRELEEEHNLDEILSRGVSTLGASPAGRQKYPEYARNAVDDHSVTSDYSTTSSTNTTRGCGHQDGPPTHGRVAGAETASTGCTARRRSADQYNSYRYDGDARTGRPAGSSKPGEKCPASIGAHPDRGVARPAGDDVLKIRKGSLDSLLDVYEHDISHIDSDVEDDDVIRKDEGLLESIASAGPQFRTLLTPGSGQKTAPSGRHLVKDATTKTELNLPRNVGDGARSFRDPTLHKSSAGGENKVIGIASRFERIKSGTDAKSIDKPSPCYKTDSRMAGAVTLGTGCAKSSSNRHLKENQPPVDSRTDNATSGKPWSEQTTTSLAQKVTTTSRSTTKPNSLQRQGSSEQNLDEYVAALHKSTEKLFGSGEDLIDLRSPEEETSEAKNANTTENTKSSAASRATDNPRSRRRRHTVGGPNDLENMKAMLAATDRYLNRGDVDRRSAWERLQPKSAVTDDIRDIRSWCAQQRLRQAGSSPALFDPRLVPAASEWPRPMWSMQAKGGDEHRASRTGSSHSLSPSSPTVAVQPSSVGFVSSI